jgi:hypothetical protein
MDDDLVRGDELVIHATVVLVLAARRLCHNHGGDPVVHAAELVDRRLGGDARVLEELHAPTVTALAI